jgi:hypothetical protein
VTASPLSLLLVWGGPAAPNLCVRGRGVLPTAMSAILEMGPSDPGKLSGTTALVSVSSVTT